MISPLGAPREREGEGVGWRERALSISSTSVAPSCYTSPFYIHVFLIIPPSPLPIFSNTSYPSHQEPSWSAAPTY